MSLPSLVPYPLPEPVARELLALAEVSDVLLLGELHGTQDVPRLTASLLPKLTTRGYGALALEIGTGERDALAAWASGETDEPPRFFAQPGADGRGNVQALALVKEAAQIRWQILCFDVNVMGTHDKWADRDAGMAENLTAQWENCCPDAKVIGICGNLHSRLQNTGAEWMREHWPSFAAALRERQPNRRIASVKIACHGGTFYNGTLQELGGTPIDAPEIQRPDDGDHTLELHLPPATAATFLAEPR